MRSVVWVGVLVGASLALAGCGGGKNGGGGGGNGGGNGGGGSSSYTVNGTVTGLTGGGLVLEETNSGQTITIQPGTTSFTVFNSVPSGTSYNVIVKTQPTGQSCTVANGSGTVGSSNVNNIAVTCATSAYTIGGSISGLAASGLTLKETVSGQTVSPAANATAFTFPTAVASGANYSVTVSAQPVGETCSVTNGSGTVATSNVTNVAVACTANVIPTYTIGGTISGLTAGGLTLQETISNQMVSPAANATSFTFATAEVSGASYSVAVNAQPTGETCTVANGSGTVGSSDVTNIAVSCAANTPPATMTGYLIDAPVDGVFYLASPSGLSGTTMSDGSFRYQSGDTVTFTALGVSLGAAAGQSGGTSIPVGGLVTPFVIAHETPGSNSSNAPNSAAIAAFLQTLSNVASGGTGTTTTLLMPSGSGVNALIAALAQQVAGNGSTLMETIANNLSTLVSNSSLVVSPATALANAFTAAQAAGSSQTTAGQAYANSVWKISGCSNGGCNIEIVLQSNGMITGLNVSQNTLLGGTWMVSGSNLEINLVVPGGGTASATVAGGATSATITYTPLSGSTSTATITEALGSGGAASIPNSGLWFANYTPAATSGGHPGQGIFLFAPDGTVAGITNSNSSLTGTWSGTSATLNLSGGSTCSLDLATLSGSCSDPNGKSGTLVLSRTALAPPALSVTGTYSGDFYLECPGCGGNTPSTGTYAATTSSNGNITITLTTTTVGEPGVNFNGAFSGTVSSSGVVSATASSTACVANGFYTLTGQIVGDSLSFTIGLPQYGACNSEYGGSGLPGTGGTATPTNAYSIGGSASFGNEAYGNCVALSLADTTVNASNTTTIQVGPGCSTPVDFTFAVSIPSGDDYAVTIPSNQPIAPYCTVTNGTGTATANVTNVSVACNAQNLGSAPFGSSTIKVLYSFQGGADGANSSGTYNGLASALVMDNSGNLYGTTALGGGGTNCVGGCGTVFKLNPGSGSESVLHAFTGDASTCVNCDGAQPLGDLILDGAGNVYGTTYAGGGSTAGFNTCSAAGCGTVYAIAPGSKTETVLAYFTGNNSGIAPKGGVILDSAGNLFGTTSLNGNSGPAYEIASGAQTPSFFGTYASIGTPQGGLILDGTGMLYGVASGFGPANATPPTSCPSGCGTVYEVAKAGGTATVLHAFAGGSDGANPDGDLAMDGAGNLYGVTEDGGSANDGTVFEIAAGTHAETLLYSFMGGSDGANPIRGLTMDSAGNLYGTTENGGSTSTCPAGGGTVFEIAAGTHTETVLYAFGCAGAAGSTPNNRLLMDGAGNLYGSTEYGGAAGNGTVYEIPQSPTTGYALGGTITGLKSAGLVLSDGSHTISPTINATTFTFFPTGYATGDAFTVSVQTQPTGQTCAVTNGTGTVGAGNVTNVLVSCTP